MPNYTVRFGDKSHDLSAENVLALHLTSVGDDHYHLLSENGASKSIEVLNLDIDNATFEISIDGQTHNGNIDLPIDNLIKQLGLDKVAGAAADKVIAPMPGLVLDIMVESGQSVSQGDNLLILEAMKMENVIKSPVDGIIKSVEVTTGDPISKSQVLVTYETP